MLDIFYIHVSNVNIHLLDNATLLLGNSDFHKIINLFVGLIIIRIYVDWC